MASIAETLLALNEILQDYDTEVKSAGPLVTTLFVFSKERSEAREKVKAAFKKRNIDAQQVKVPKSTFEGLRVSESARSYLNIVFKPKKGGGSGAGAALTKMAESAQAVQSRKEREKENPQQPEAPKPEPQRTEPVDTKPTSQPQVKQEPAPVPKPEEKKKKKPQSELQKRMYAAGEKLGLSDE